MRKMALKACGVASSNSRPTPLGRRACMRSGPKFISGSIFCFATCNCTNAGVKLSLRFGRGNPSGPTKLSCRAALSIHLRSKLALTPYSMAMRDTETPGLAHSWTNWRFAWRLYMQRPSLLCAVTSRAFNSVFISVIGVHLEGTWTPSLSELGPAGKDVVY